MTLKIPVIIFGDVVQLVRMPPCHGGDSRVRVPSSPQPNKSVVNVEVYMRYGTTLRDDALVGRVTVNATR